MKKIFKLAVLLMPFILFSCFEFVGTGTSRRMLNLALAAPGDVAKLHLAVCDGVVSPETIILNITLDPNSSIPLDLPAGNNRIIVIWAEGFSGTANYYGYTPPMNISDDNTTPVPIRMIKFSSIQGFNAINPIARPWMRWDAIPGALIYEIEQRVTLGMTQIWVHNAFTTENFYDVDSISNLRVRVYSSIFVLSSDPSPLVN